MPIRSVAKKTWPILGIFALVGIGLAIGLPLAGIFVPFGLTLGGVIGAAALLFLASIGVAALLIIAMNAIFESFKYFFPVSASETSKTVGPQTENSTNVTETTNNKSNCNYGAYFTTNTHGGSKLNNSPLLPSPSNNTASSTGEQSRKDAEEVKNYIANLFQKDGEIYQRDKWIPLGGRCNKTLEWALKQNDWFYLKKVVSGNQHEQYAIVFSNTEYWRASQKVDDNQGFKYFKREVDKKWKRDIVKIGTYDEGGNSFHKAEISPEDIQEILREMRANQATSSMKPKF